MDGMRSRCSSRVEDGTHHSAAAYGNKLHLMPELERLLTLLVAKTANSNERTADMSSQALVHIACHTPIGPKCVTQVLLEHAVTEAVSYTCSV